MILSKTVLSKGTFPQSPAFSKLCSTAMPLDCLEFVDCRPDSNDLDKLLSVRPVKELKLIDERRGYNAHIVSPSDWLARVIQTRTPGFQKLIIIAYADISCRELKLKGLGSGLLRNRCQASLWRA